MRRFAVAQLLIAFILALLPLGCASQDIRQPDEPIDSRQEVERVSAADFLDSDGSPDFVLDRISAVESGTRFQVGDISFESDELLDKDIHPGDMVDVEAGRLMPDRTSFQAVSVALTKEGPHHDLLSALESEGMAIDRCFFVLYEDSGWAGYYPASMETSAFPPAIWVAQAPQQQEPFPFERYSGVRHVTGAGYDVKLLDKYFGGESALAAEAYTRSALEQLEREE